MAKDMCSDVRSSWISIALVLAILTGCNKGPKLYDVQGIVNVNGKPTEGITLLFFKEGGGFATASGNSITDGKFSITTDGKPGIELGKYELVAIYPDPSFKVPKVAMGESPPDAPDLFKGKYLKNKVAVDISSADAVVIELTK